MCISISSLSDRSLGVSSTGQKKICKCYCIDIQTQCRLNNCYFHAIITPNPILGVSYVVLASFYQYLLVISSLR